MKLIRMRISLGQSLIAVALIALACLWARESWLKKVGLTYPNALLNSSLSVRGTRDVESVAGQSIPLEIQYRLILSPTKLREGTPVLAWAEVWIEDETGIEVDGYCFDALLTVGVRESTAGSLTWEPAITHPGRYTIHHRLLYQDPSGDWVDDSGGSHRGFEVGPVPSEDLGEQP